MPLNPRTAQTQHRKDATHSNEKSARGYTNKTSLNWSTAKTFTIFQHVSKGSYNRLYFLRKKTSIHSNFFFSNRMQFLYCLKDIFTSV